MRKLKKLFIVTRLPFMVFCLLTSGFCVLSFSGCGGSKKLSEEEKIKQVILKSKLQNEINSEIKNKLLPANYTLKRSASYIERTLTNVSIYDNYAYVDADFTIYADFSILDNQQNFNLLGYKDVTLRAYGTYYLYKDPLDDLWFISEYPEYNLFFKQGTPNEPTISNILVSPSTLNAGDTFNVSANVSAYNSTNELFVAFRINALGIYDYMYDDGVIPDAKANDGIYSGQLTIPIDALNGEYIALVDVIDKTLSADLTSDSTDPTGYLYHYTGSIQTLNFTVGLLLGKR